MAFAELWLIVVVSMMMVMMLGLSRPKGLCRYVAAKRGPALQEHQRINQSKSSASAVRRVANGRSRAAHAKPSAAKKARRVSEGALSRDFGRAVVEAAG